MKPYIGYEELIRPPAPAQALSLALAQHPVLNSSFVVGSETVASKEEALLQMHADHNIGEGLVRIC